MKKFLISLIFATGCLSALAQSYPCDPAQNGLAITPGTIAVGQFANFKFDVYNGGSSFGCTIAPNSVEVVLSLPQTAGGAPNYYAFQSFVSPANGVGTYFTWTYDALNNVIIGNNTAPIPNGMGELGVTIRVQGINVTSGGGATSNLNIQVNSGSNNPSNDVSTAPLIVTTALATTLTDLSTESADCIAKIKWTAANEDAGTRYEVEYSADNRNFVKVTTIPGRSNGTATAYEYAYNQGSGRGFYRLRMVNANGTASYSRIVPATTKCNVKKVFLYPNPVKQQEILHINVTGYEGAVSGEMTNESGQVVMKNKLQNGLNNVPMIKLPQGTYNYKVFDDAKEIQTYKVIVIQ